MMGKSSRSWVLLVLLIVGGGLVSIGCASSGLAGSREASHPLIGAVRASDEADPVDSGDPGEIVQASSEEGSEPIPLELSLTLEADPVIEEYDPWMPFNEGVFAFNRQFDRILLKPVATVWDRVLPDPVQRSLKNALDNLGMPRRVANNLLQGKGAGAVREVGRFLINSTVGVAGLFDVAKSAFGLQPGDEDAGQTLGVWGFRPGPYLILPILPPLTVRDGIGTAIDLALDPLSYVLPFAALAGMAGGKGVNERSLTLDLFQSVEEGAVDLYSAVRNGYLQRRQKQMKE
ncbi:MAG: VacJ family lipoprotein [Candidatus Rokubacteria bacterium]|nr:VacJ family lipoprotein [Candidatus Rokubacteria bacterium]